MQTFERTTFRRANKSVQNHFRPPKFAFDVGAITEIIVAKNSLADSPGFC